MAGAAIVFATAVGDSEFPAPVARCGENTLLGRLLDQFARLGIERVQVITRPGMTSDIAPIINRSDMKIEIRLSGHVAEDLRLVADIAADTSEPLVISHGDILTHSEALAGLLADPRVASGILTTTATPRGWWTHRTRSERGRVVSAGSAFHHVRKPTGYFLGVLKVDPRDRPALTKAVLRMADIADAPPPEWEEAHEYKRTAWRRKAAAAALVAEVAENDVPGAAPEPPFAVEGVEVDLDAVELDDETERRLAVRSAVTRQDAVSLSLVGLVRTRVHLTNSYLRQLYWARPITQEAADLAQERLQRYDEDRVLLNSAVKASDGFFTTFFVSPYSKFIARWAARRGLTPNQITAFSMALGVVAAVLFATGSRAGLITGAVTLQAAFTFDCVDGQLARYTRTFSKFGAWLDSVFDRGKEYAVYAGLAIGATVGFGDSVWALAAAALGLQTVRHSVDFSFAASRHQVLAALPLVPLEQPSDRRAPAGTTEEAYDEDEDAQRPEGQEVEEAAGARPPWHVLLGRTAIRVSRRLDRRPATRWVKRIVVLPIGERFALISVTAALFEPRVTFLALLIWGSAAMAYQLTGKVLRSVAA